MGEFNINGNAIMRDRILNNSNTEMNYGSNDNNNNLNIVRRHPQLDPRITNTQLLNYRDPITLTEYENLNYNNQRFLVLVNSRNPSTGTVHSEVFDARALLRMINSGNTRNPLTRNPFNANQINNIRRRANGGQMNQFNPNRRSPDIRTAVNTVFALSSAPDHSSRSIRSRFSNPGRRSRMFTSQNRDRARGRRFP